MTSNDPPPPFYPEPTQAEPDPHQPPAPTPHAARPGYGQALLATLIWAGVSLVVVLLTVGPPPSARATGVLTAGLLIPTLLAALATGLIARRVHRPHGWPFWQLVLLALPVSLFFRLLLAFLATR